MVLTIGGDGTHSLFINSIIKKDKNFSCDNMKLLNVPMGTGNDCTIANNFKDFLELIKTRKMNIFKLSLTEIEIGENIYYSNNVMSLGIDAFIVKMTEKFKNLFKSDSYKLIGKIAPLLYNFYYKIAPIDVLIENNDFKINRYAKKYAMITYSLFWRQNIWWWSAYLA